jgi:U2 small nuclear ribonucleoprotein A'
VCGKEEHLNRLSSFQASSASAFLKSEIVFYKIGYWLLIVPTRMVKLTPELIHNSYQRMNAVRDRELDLRGYKIPLLENLGATLNQFDTLDLTDNDLRKVDNFPLLPRLKTLFFNNNRISKCAPNLYETLPNLETLILTNNVIADLSEIDSLANILSLRTLSLLFNPVSTKENYRRYTVYRIPQLKLLDFKKIKEKEREEAKSFFKSKPGKDLRKLIAQTVADNLEHEDVNATPERRVATENQVSAIKRAITAATTLEEIERLNQMLQSGQISSIDGDENSSDMQTE